jgi:hypothetical protein
MTDTKYPEHEKLQPQVEFSQRCGEFVVWMNEEHGILLAKYDERQDACRNCQHEDIHKPRRGSAGWYYCSFEDDATGECCDCGRADFGNPNQLCQQNRALNDLLAEFFGIDRNKLEEEKRQMLDEMREANKP